MNALNEVLAATFDATRAALPSIETPLMTDKATNAPLIRFHGYVTVDGHRFFEHDYLSTSALELQNHLALRVDALDMRGNHSLSIVVTPT